MKVGIDVSPLVQTGAGTARHVRGLLSGLQGRPELDLRRVGFGGRGRAATIARDTVWYPAGLARAARGLDVLHCTTMRIPLRAGPAVVATVHDAAVIRYPKAFPVWHRYTGRLALRQAVRTADAIVAVSAFTRHELADLLGIPGERVRVIGNGVDPVFTADGPAASGDYVLAVGTLEPRKNLARAVEAARLAQVELRVVGEPGWGGVDVPNWVGRTDDEELAALYRGARCLVFPSLYEGFGIPILEAMACGTPVVTSIGGATEEVAGGAAVLVDPRDPTSIAGGIAEAEHRRVELIRLGRERSQEFTWQRAADEVDSAVARARMNDPLIVVDADVLGRSRTGDETYVLNLLRELPDLAAAAGLRIGAVTRRPDLVPAGVEPIPLAVRSQELRMAWGLARTLRMAGAALVHTQYALPVRSPCPVVVTIHDVSFERDPTLMGRRRRWAFRLVVPRAARGAAHILTVSERSKRDIIELYDVAAERITVTANGVDAVFAPGEPGTRDYVLAVGAIQRRKNQLAALAAAQAAGLPLVIVGPEKDPGLARELRRQGATLRGYVPIDELAALYRGAACLVQASRYEGFGLPVLEAMASGTPVVTVPDDAILEVVGEAAVVVEVLELGEGIRRAIAERQHLSSAGLERSRLFSWRRAAERTIAVYHEALRQ